MMSRRDTIVLAVLLNTGLLAVLFIIAVNPESEQPKAMPAAKNVQVEVQRSKPAAEESQIAFESQNRTDEVDNVLKDFAATLNVDKVIARSNPSQEPEKKGNGEPKPHPSPFSAERRHPYDSEEIAMNLSSRKNENPPARQRSFFEERQYEEKRREEKARANEPETVEIVVKRGDILGRIAQANNTTIAAIKELNDLGDDSLQIGQILRVPVGAKPASPGQPSPVAERHSEESGKNFQRYYIIESGDNPWKIAKRFNVSVKELLSLNQLDENKARNLRPGDRIRVH